MGADQILPESWRFLRKVIQGFRFDEALNEVADWSRDKERAKVGSLLPRAAAVARQGEVRSRRTVSSVGIRPAERKPRFFVVISVPVIAAEERRSYSFDRVEDAIAIARGVGSDREEDGVLPRRALVAQAIAPMR
jgi:hypothetical protein